MKLRVNGIEWFASFFGLRVTYHSRGYFTVSHPLSNREWNIYVSIHFGCMIDGGMLLFSLLLLSLCMISMDVRSPGDGLFTSLVTLFYVEELKS